MGDVLGPVSTLPGARHAVPANAVCDQCGAPATRRVQGETDSFGCEVDDYCDSCFKKMQEEALKADTSGTCEWCKTRAPKLFNRRDMDEGMYGRVYQVCDPCIDKDEKRLREELAQYEPLDEGPGFDD